MKKNKSKPKRFFTKTVIIIIAVLAAAGLAGGLAYRHYTSTEDVRQARREKAERDRESREEAVVGQWEAVGDRTFTVDVWRDERGIYHAIINRLEKKDTVSFWEMSGVWVGNINGFQYFDCTKSLTEYDSAGDESTEEKYINGEGSIYAKDGILMWEDSEEDAGKNIKFEYVGEY